MSKFLLSKYTKNYSLYPNHPVEIESDFLPRIGEIIELDVPLGSFDELFVFDIRYEMTGSSLTPHVHAREWHRGDRALELQERGWLLG